jgi:heme exporter protein A
VLEADGLACVRGERTLFYGLSFRVDGGESLQVTGVNGSGKSSLLRILATLLPPAQGEARWRNKSVRGLGEDYRREFVYIGHLNALKDELTVSENVRTAASLMNANGIDEALSRLQLQRVRSLPVRNLSQGQKRRTALARLALTPQPALWILDEPLAALDAYSCTAVAALMRSHLDLGGIVVAATHHDLGFEVTRRIALSDDANA